MLTNTAETIIPASRRLRCLWKQMASHLVALGMLSLICTGLYIWVFGINPPIPSPSQNSGDPLAHNHMVNTEQCPHRSSIIYLRHKPRASRRCFMTTEEGFSSQSRRTRSGPGPAASRQVTGSFNSLSSFF